MSSLDQDVQELAELTDEEFSALSTDQKTLLYHEWLDASLEAARRFNLIHDTDACSIICSELLARSEPTLWHGAKAHYLLGLNEHSISHAEQAVAVLEELERERPYNEDIRTLLNKARVVLALETSRNELILPLVN